jgi:uncharacterized membrane protein
MRNIVRSTLAIFAGYFVFAVSAVLLFSMSGYDPHDAVPPWFLAASILYGMLFAALGGYVAAFIAQYKPSVHALILTIVIATGALISLLASPGKGAQWSQLAAIILMAPSALIGGYFRGRQSPDRSND